jgi:hypothetical protein
MVTRTRLHVTFYVYIPYRVFSIIETVEDNIKRN